MHFNKRKFVKKLYEKRWTYFIRILFGFIGLFIILRLIFNFGTFTSFPSYIKYIVCDLNFEVYIGIAISLLGCLIGVFVLEQIKPDDAVTLNEFLDLTNDLLCQAKPKDELLFILPTFYIGGRVKEYEHRAFIEKLHDQVNAGVIIEMYVLSHDKTLDDKYLDVVDGNNKKYEVLYSKEFNEDLLVKFHKEIFHLPSRKGKVNLEDYFDEFFTTAKFLNEKNIVKNLKKEYGAIRIVGVINKKQNKAILGTYSIDNGIVPSGQLIENQETVTSIHMLLIKLIDEFKE